MQVPLEDGSVDIGVFCLSLMGTNYQDYIMEARRVLKKAYEILKLFLFAEISLSFSC